MHRLRINRALCNRIEYIQKPQMQKETKELMKNHIEMSEWNERARGSANNSIYVCNFSVRLLFGALDIPQRPLQRIIVTARFHANQFQHSTMLLLLLRFFLVYFNAIH